MLSLEFQDDPEPGWEGRGCILLRFIPIPEDLITNTALGGPDMETLYTTAGKSLYKVRTETAGLAR